MSGVWGKNIKVTIFGESHGKAVGVIMDGFPAGIRFNQEEIKRELQRRAAKNNDFSTARQEKDDFEILSGYFREYTTGSPLSVIIRNKDVRSKDYEQLENVMRPGHADYTAHMKYKGFNDYRGGGHSSGRLTAPLVLAGAMAKQMLAKKDIVLGSHIKSILDIEDQTFNDSTIQESTLRDLSYRDFPVLDERQGAKMQEMIIAAKNQLDSVGGIIETVVINMPAGIGEPFFHSLESRLSQMIFSIPAVKAIEFGKGFDITKMKGSQARDEYIIKKGKIKTQSNHNGGILGGVSNGMPILFNTAIKPTSSIGQVQNTLDIEKMQEVKLEIQGRHDACILPRVVPVVEAVTALVILDLLIEQEGKSWMS